MGKAAHLPRPQEGQTSEAAGGPLMARSQGLGKHPYFHKSGHTTHDDHRSLVPDLEHVGKVEHSSAI